MSTYNRYCDRGPYANVERKGIINPSLGPGGPIVLSLVVLSLDYGEFWRKMIGRCTLDSAHPVHRRHFPGRLPLSSGFCS